MLKVNTGTLSVHTASFSETDNSFDRDETKTARNNQDIEYRAEKSSEKFQIAGTLFSIYSDYSSNPCDLQFICIFEISLKIYIVTICLQYQYPKNARHNCFENFILCPELIIAEEYSLPDRRLPCTRNSRVQDCTERTRYEEMHKI